MTSTTITNFRKNIFAFIEQAVKFHDVVNISTKSGNAVVISEDDYNSLTETLYLKSIPELVESIKEASQESIEDCVPADEIEWTDV